MPLTTLIRFALVGAACLFVSGCILSPAPLFDEADAVTPLTPGKYTERSRQEDGSFRDEAVVTLALNGKVYALSGDDERDPVNFTLHDGGNGLLIAMAIEEGEGGYAIVRAEGEEIVNWASVCEVADDLGVLANYPGIENDGLSCSVPDAGTLKAFLTDYAAAAKPDFRYVPAVQ